MAVIVNQAYGTLGNGARKQVKLANGNLIAIAHDGTQTTFFYKSTDGGATWTQLCYMNGSGVGSALASIGNMVYVVYTDGSSVYSLAIDPATVANANQAANKVTIDTQTVVYEGYCSIAKNGTELHAAWASRDAIYPNSSNIRYSKSLDGGATWAAPIWLTTDNIADTYNEHADIAISSGRPIIAFRWRDATSYKICCQYYIVGWNAATIKDGTTYNHDMPSLVIESTGHILCFYSGKDVTDNAKLNVRCSESVNSGANWGAEDKLTSGNTYDQNFPSASVSFALLDDIYLYFIGRAAGTYNQVRRMVRTSGSWGEVSDLTAYTTGSASGVKAMAAETGGTIGYVWKNAQNSRVEFDKEDLNVAPNAPTGLTRSNFDAAIVADLSWTFSDDNPGDTQSAYKLKIREVGTADWYYAQADGTIAVGEVWVASATSEFAMNAAVLTNEKSYEWYAATKDAAGLEGPYSAQATFYTSAIPTCTITYPANDLDAHSTSTVTAQWSFGHTGAATQKKYQVRLTDNADAELWTSGEVTDASARSKTVVYALVNATTYKLKVKVMSTKDLWSTEVVRTFVVSYTAPATPTIVVTGVDASGYIRVAITNPAPTGTQPTVTNNDVYRRVSGATAWTRIKVGLAEDGIYDDYHVASGVTYDYKVRANGDNATYTDSLVVSESVILSVMWLHGVLSPAATLKHFDLRGSRIVNWQADVTFMKFAGRSKPVAEFGESEQSKLTVQIICAENSTDYADLKALARSKAIICYRDRSRLMFGVIGSLLESDEFQPLNPSLTLEVLEVDFSEAM